MLLLLFAVVGMTWAFRLPSLSSFDGRFGAYERKSDVAPKKDRVPRSGRAGERYGAWRRERRERRERRDRREPSTSEGRPERRRPVRDGALGRRQRERRQQERSVRDGAAGRRRKTGKDAAKDAKDVYNRIQNGDNAFDAVADKVSDKIAQRAKIPVGPTGQAINAINDGLQKLGAPKEVTDATQMAADAVPANFIQNTFASSLRMLKGRKAVVEERDKWARGENGAPLQGYGQVSRLLQCKARGCSTYEALSFATKGSENTLPYKIGSSIGGAVFDLTSDGKKLRKMREENARDNRDIADNQKASKYARESGLKRLTVRQMREVQEKCNGNEMCIRLQVIARQGEVDKSRSAPINYADPREIRDSVTIARRAANFAQQNNRPMPSREELVRIQQTCGGGREYQAGCVEEQLRTNAGLKLEWDRQW